MPLLTRDAILQVQDIKFEDVPVPEWGGEVRVRMMTGAERDELGAAIVGPDKKPDMKRYRMLLLAACVVGEDGKPLFANADELAPKSGVALDRIYRVAERLNDAGPGAVEAAQGN